MKKVNALKVIPGDTIDSKFVVKAKDHARKRFVSQGVTTDISANLSTSFIVPFAELIKATTAQIGFLSALSGLLAPIGNLWGSKQMEKHSRKRIFIKYTIFEAIFLVPLLLLVYLFWNNLATPYLPMILIVSYALLVFFTGVKGPPFFSWIGDVVPEDERGKYFAQRNKWIGAAGLAAFLGGGFILKYFEGGQVLIGYAIIFSLALVLKVYSAYQIKHIFSPHFKLEKKYYFSMWSFLKRYDNFGKFAVFQASFNFAIMVASPFFAVYMLKDLGFDLLTFTIVSLSTTLFYLAFTPLAGKFSDKYGNLRLLYIAGFTFPITPLLWIFITKPIWLILIPGVISGLANAAFTLGVTNYTYESVSPQKRGIITAYVGLLNGVGIFLGSIAGGLMIDYLPINFMNTTLFVFIMAAVLRLLVAVMFLPQLQDTKKTSSLKGLSVDIHHPFKMVHSDIVWFKRFVWSK